MSVKIGHASIDERGKIAGGKLGDQTGKEICIRDWYDKGWDVYLECTDESVANKAATYMEQICNDPNFGYDQKERNSGYVSIFRNGLKVKGAKGEFDCSSLVAACYKMAGLEINSILTTSTLKRALLDTGVFVAYTDSSHLLSGNASKRGGVYLKAGSHVVMVTENIKKRPQNPYATPTTTVEFGETGICVRWVQWELRRLGHVLAVTGDFESTTDRHVKDFQRVTGLEVDGKVGPITRKALQDEC